MNFESLVHLYIKTDLNVRMNTHNLIQKPRCFGGIFCNVNRKLFLNHHAIYHFHPPKSTFSFEEKRVGKMRSEVNFRMSGPLRIAAVNFASDRFGNI